MEDMMEGGFINDRSGKATKKVREEMPMKMKQHMMPEMHKEMRKGNPAMKKFRGN